MDEFHRQECEHAALGLEFPRRDAKEYEVNGKFGQDAKYAPLPWEIQKERAPRANEHPDVVGVDKREHQDVRFAFVVRAVAAPAGPLVEKLFPSVDGGSFYHGVLVEVVADFCAWNFHHFVDEHVIVTARKIDEVTEPAHFEE